MEGVRAVYGDEVATRDYGELVPVRRSANHDERRNDGRACRAAAPRSSTRPATRTITTVFGMREFGLVYRRYVRNRVSGACDAAVHSCSRDDSDAVRSRGLARLGRAPARASAEDHVPHALWAVCNAERLAVQLLAQVDAMASAARALTDAPGRHDALKRAFAEIYISELRRVGSTQPEQWLREILATDIELNAQGLGAWLGKGSG